MSTRPRGEQLGTAARVMPGASSTIGRAPMRGFADDPNYAPYVDDIYAYLQARADGTLGRGRPEKLQP